MNKSFIKDYDNPVNLSFKSNIDYNTDYSSLLSNKNLENLNVNSSSHIIASNLNITKKINNIK